MANTGKGYPYPLGSDGPDGADVPYWMNLLAVFLNTNGAMYDSGSALPAAGKAGRFFRLTSVSPNTIHLDTGSAWIDVGGFTQTLADTLYAAIDDPALTDQRVPVDASVTAAKIADALKPSVGASGATEALRALGTAAGTAAAGNDVRLNPPTALVYRSAGAKSIPDAAGSSTTVDFDSEHADTDTIHDVATNNSRLTAKTAGIYLIAASGIEVNIQFAKIRLNGSTIIGGGNPTAAGGEDRSIQAFAIRQLAVNDYVELRASGVGTTPSITVEFGMTKIA